MAKFLLHIKRLELCRSIVLRLLNKFDFVLGIEGGTGTGKSTLAIEIARGVRAEFRKLFRLDLETVEYYYDHVIKQQGISIEEFCNNLLKLKKEKAYNYNPYNDLIYDQKSMMRALSSWNRIFISDEVVNVLFNRDFQGENQKKIIKIINMYRDHKNLIIMNVPRFQTLDVQIKNLTKMRISIAKRGAGVIHTPNDTIYGKDIWDSILNEKIERGWLNKGNKPKYTKLTTARGLIAFPPLAKAVEDEYQKIKNDKRANIVEKDFGINHEQEHEKKEPILQIYDQLVAGKIKNSAQLEGFALAHNLDLHSSKEKIRRLLTKNCKGSSIAEFYWDKKAKVENNEDALKSLVR